MGRFLASYLAGIIVIVGGWLGWTSADRVDEAVSASADLVVPGPSGDARAQGRVAPRADSDSSRALSIGGTEPSPPCGIRTPSSASGMNRVMARLDDQPMLRGGDHGGSVQLADGRRMFFYGDTVRDPTTVSPFMVRNSALVLDRGCLRPMDGQDGDAVIPDDSDNTGYWPMSMRAVEVPGGTRVRVITNRVQAVGPLEGDTLPDSPDAFRTLGSSMATFEVPTDRTPRFVGQTPLTPDTTDPRVPAWGAAMWEHDGTLYVFGTASNETKTTAGWSLHVARTSPDELADPDAWEYWDGNRWIPDAAGAARTDSSPLIPAEMGVSHVLSVFERAGSWYAVSKEGDFHGTSLAVWKAPEVTGPWTKHLVRPLKNSAGLRRYTPLAHPHFTLPSGRLLISWSEAPTDAGLYYTNPELYRSMFDEIRLP
ncbi:DUF4185 domain-containing protein [Janibacter alittae]|uniref:DUF4185 domain-containing protein n=1 Tax=Janibacter alittae TaxID=3115209 RepID=A0ABZ2MFH2_9MICO